MIKNRCNLILLFFLFFHVLSPFSGIAQLVKKDTIPDAVENDTLKKRENEELNKNTIFLELSGNFNHYNIGYDRMFWSKDIHKLSIATGVSYLPGLSGYNNLHISTQVNYFAGTKHNLEFGFGYAYGQAKNKQEFHNYHLLVFRTGYRHQKHEKGLFIRVGLTPFIVLSESLYFSAFPNIPYLDWIDIGFALGWTF